MRAGDFAPESVIANDADPVFGREVDAVLAAGGEPDDKTCGPSAGPPDPVAAHRYPAWVDN